MSHAKSEIDKTESKIIPLIPEQVRRRMQIVSHGVLTPPVVSSHAATVTSLYASKHLGTKDLLERSRYSLTSVSERLMHSKKVLGGQD